SLAPPGLRGRRRRWPRRQPCGAAPGVGAPPDPLRPLGGPDGEAVARSSDTRRDDLVSIPERRAVSTPGGGAGRRSSPPGRRGRREAEEFEGAVLDVEIGRAHV